jgi:putative transposase
MPRAYSNDLRERVVRAVEAGQSCRSAALRFGVAPSSAIKWMKRWRERGDVTPGSSRGRIRSPLHAHREWLLELIAAEAEVTLAEVQQRLAGRGLAVGIGSIWRFFNREGVRFKKNAAALRAGQVRRRAQASELEALSGQDRR